MQLIEDTVQHIWQTLGINLTETTKRGECIQINQPALSYSEPVVYLNTNAPSTGEHERTLQLQSTGIIDMSVTSGFEYAMRTVHETFKEHQRFGNRHRLDNLQNDVLGHLWGYIFATSEPMWQIMRRVVQPTRSILYVPELQCELYDQWGEINLRHGIQLYPKDVNDNPEKMILLQSSTSTSSDPLSGLTIYPDRLGAVLNMNLRVTTNLMQWTAANDAGMMGFMLGMMWHITTPKYNIYWLNFASTYGYRSAPERQELADGNLQWARNFVRGISPLGRVKHMETIDRVVIPIC